MGGILSSFRRLFKRRKFQRYAVMDGTFVLISPGKGDEDDPELEVQLIDISHGGMAFIYQGSPSDLESSGILKMLTTSPYGQKIYFDTASDVPLPADEPISEPLRRRGVKFKWMGLFEQAELRDLIHSIGICKK